MVVSRGPLLKGVAPPMADDERLDMLRQAIKTIAQRHDMAPRLQARGIAPLAWAAKRLESKLNPGASDDKRYKQG